MEKSFLKKLVDDNMTLAEIVRVTGKSNTCTRYWIKKFKLCPVVKFKSAKYQIMSKDELQNLIDNSDSFVRAFMKVHSTKIFSSGAYLTFKNRLKELNVNCDKIINDKKKFNNSNIAVPLSEVLIEDSTYSTGHLKRRLINNGILKNECSKCKIKPIWNGEPLTLHLDHIDGIRKNATIRNLRLLCPNCHSQTSTYSRTKSIKKVYHCQCGSEINKQSKKCVSCAHEDMRHIKSSV